METPRNTCLFVPSRLKARPVLSSSGEVPCIVTVSRHVEPADMPGSLGIKEDKFPAKIMNVNESRDRGFTMRFLNAKFSA